jgi:hypothetical protein
MFKRFVVGTGGIVAAITGPAALFKVNDHFTGNHTVVQATARPGDMPAVPLAYGGTTNPANPALPPVPSTIAATQPLTNAPLTMLAAASQSPGNEPPRVPSVSMPEAFNMNATPEWIANRWPRVANGLSQINLQGYRVPLVTGTSTLDVAGSLTYYFNPLQQVERITFQGTTGDPRNLIGLMSQRFQLSRRLTNDPGLVVYEGPHGHFEQPKSHLQIRPAGILQSSDPFHRFDVDLVLQREKE